MAAPAVQAQDRCIKTEPIRSPSAHRPVRRLRWRHRTCCHPSCCHPAAPNSSALPPQPLPSHSAFPASSPRQRPGPGGGPLPPEVPRRRARAEARANAVSPDEGLLESDQVVHMQTLGQRAQGRPALEPMPQLCVF